MTRVLAALPYTARIALGAIATAWPAAGYGALVITSAGDFASTGTAWIFGVPFLLALLASTITHLLLMGAGRAWGVPMLPGMDELNRALVALSASETGPSSPVEAALLARARSEILRLPLFNAAIGATLGVIVTTTMVVLESALTGGSSPNRWVIARGGLFVTALLFVGGLAIVELLVRPGCLRLRRAAAAAQLGPEHGFTLPNQVRLGLAVVPVVVALLVAAELGTSETRDPAAYIQLITLTALVTLALEGIQLRSSRSALRELADACRDLASGRDSQVITGSLDGDVLRVANEFDAAAESVRADRSAASIALRRSLRRLEEHYRLAIVLSGHPREIAEHVVRALAELLDVPLATVETLDDEEIVVLAMSRDGELSSGQRFALADTPCARVRADREHCVFDRAAERFPRDGFLSAERIDTYVGVPILAGDGAVCGIINVLDRRPRELSDEDLQLLYTFARRIGAALEAQRFEAERAALTARLEEQVAALRAAQQRLIEADRIKTEFVGMMSHELRTPVNILLGYTEMLLDDASRAAATPRLSPEERHRYLGRILTSATTLAELVEDTLSALRLDAGVVSLNIERVSLDQLFTELAALGKSLTTRPQVVESWLVDPDVPELLTDRRKLRQVVTNLVGNARKFTTAGRIQVRAARAGSDRVRLWVSDTGCGIAADDLPIIFDLYRQAPGGPDHDGCGLGLYIVRRYVQMLQGRVECTSTRGAGTTFLVELPLVSRSATDSGRPESV